MRIGQRQVSLLRLPRTRRILDLNLNLNPFLLVGNSSGSEKEMSQRDVCDFFRRAVAVPSGPFSWTSRLP